MVFSLDMFQTILLFSLRLLGEFSCEYWLICLLVPKFEELCMIKKAI